MRTSRPTRRTAVAAALITLGVAGIGVASAARLALETDALGAGSTVVARCQPDSKPIGVSFTTKLEQGQFRVSEVVLGNVQCLPGTPVQVALSTGGQTLVEAAGVVADSGPTSIAVDPVLAEKVDRVAVLIEG